MSRRQINRVDTHSGEVVGEETRCAHLDECEDCAETAAALEELERKFRGAMATITGLRRKKERTAKDHPRWEEAEACFAHWRIVCKHPRSELDAERFEEVLPFLEDKRYGKTSVLRAIDGVAFDPYVDQRKNGTLKRHDGWHVIFGSTGKLEDKANKAPRGWSPAVSREMESWKQGPEGVLMPADWKAPPPEDESGQSRLAA